MALQPYGEEDLNYFKLSSLVLNEFPRALRQTFKTMWDKTYGHRPGFLLWDDSTAVRNLFASEEGSKNRVPVHQSYSEWDCTALFQATIYSRTFALHHGTLNEVYIKPRGLSASHFHPSVMSITGDNTETWALAIDQLRLLRNFVCHLSSSKMEKVIFDECVQRAKDAFLALGVSTAPIDAVGSLTESNFPTNEVRRLEEAIKEANRAYIKWLESIISDTADKEDIAMLAQKINELKSLLDEVANSSTSDIGEEHKSTAKSYHSLGITQLELGDLKSALSSHRRALDIFFKLFGEIHENTADSYYQLGIIQRELGFLRAALNCHQHAISIRIKLFGEKHKCIADSYYSLGITQRGLGDLKSALRSNQRALAIRIELFGEAHKCTADSYYLLGITQLELGNLKSALKSHQRALAISIKVFGEDHKSTADSYYYLGKTQRELGDLTSALQSHQRALAIRIKVFGEDHQSISKSKLELEEIQHTFGPGSVKEAC